MEGSDWQGGRKDGRLYRKVRAEMQRVIREKYERLKGCLDERARRLWAGSEAITFGRGGIRAVAEAMEISQQVVIAGSRELKGESPERVSQRQGGSDGPEGDGKRKPSKNRVW